MSFLRPYRVQSLLLRITYRPLSPVAFRARFASGYGDPSDEAHPTTAKPQEQGSSTQKKQPEHPGPRENEPSHQGSSSKNDKGQESNVDSASTESKSSGRDVSWQGNGAPGGSRVHGSEKKETRLGGSLSMNKDKTTDSQDESGVGDSRVEGDLEPEGQTDGKDARDVGGKDDSRKQS
jgi:hypothetical protein